MRVSVIGARGFIGSALCRNLQETGCEVYAPSRQDNHPPKGGWGRLVWAAGLTANFRQKPMQTVQSHVCDLARMLSTDSVEGIVYLSSTRVYQRSTKTSEDTPLPCLSTDPSDLYNLSKLMGESVCLNASIKRVKIARLSNIVGPGEAARSTFVGALCREAKAGQITLQSARQSAKDYLWIEDAARYLTAMVLDDQSGVYNVASGTQISHANWSKAIATTTGASEHCVPDAPDGGFAAIDVAKLHDHYGPASVNPLEHVNAIVGAA